MTIQTTLFPGSPEGRIPDRGAAMPPGFRYQPDIITPEEEASLAAEIARLDLKPFDFHGYEGLRRIHAFGYRYDYTRRAVDVADNIPDFLRPLRDKIAGFAGRAPEDFRQILATEYAPGAPIGWHKDKPQFGMIVGVSLLSPALFRLRRRTGDRWERASRVIEPRSAYMMAGEARHEWEHSIPKGETLRYSLTFRTLAAGFAPPDASGE